MFGNRLHECYKGTITVGVFQDIHLLDAGCGTGHYAKVLVDMGVGELHLMDACPDMLNIAKDKLKDAIKQNIVASVVEAKLPDLPFQDGIFDAVMYNHVSTHYSLPQREIYNVIMWLLCNGELMHFEGMQVYRNCFV